MDGYLSAGRTRPTAQRVVEQGPTRRSRVAREYSKLRRLREELAQCQQNLRALVTEGNLVDALEVEIGSLGPAFESVLEKELSILHMHPETSVDLALKVVVCAENDFASDLLNGLLEKDARTLLANKR